MEPAWFAVLTRGRHERTVYDQLRRKGLESFLPTIARWSRWRDRRKLIEWPLFPSYCFVRFGAHHLLAVRSCVGVVHIVSCGDRPAPVPDVEIDSIRQLLATTLRYDPCPFVREGAMVEVTHGPLAGVRGRLVHKGPDTRLVLAIEMLGRAVSVGIHAADVQPLPA